MTRMGIAFALVLTMAACDDGPEADRLYVGGQCDSNDDCYQDENFVQICLMQFKGGYCGIQDCVDDLDCPEASKCVAHDDGTNYCFRVCVDKPECNGNRDVENEANCSASVTFTDGGDGLKACVPPSSG
jgi:hypothetical protein